LFGKRATDIVSAHPPSKPLLLYVPFNAVHNFLSVPDGWNETEIAKTVVSDVTYEPRQKFAGALYLMDQECKAIVGALKAKGMYKNSIIVMASDNGGSPIDGGNNWPLRGAKKTMFEGGHRVPSFIHSPLLDAEVVEGVKRESVCEVVCVKCEVV
jgi:arylsulfatase A-like enzyme